MINKKTESISELQYNTDRKFDILSARSYFGHQSDASTSSPDYDVKSRISTVSNRELSKSKSIFQITLDYL